MASEAPSTRLDQDGADSTTQEESDSVLKEADDASTTAMEDRSETAAVSTQETSALPPANNTQEVPEDGEWSVVKQCLSVFVIEVYQCKLCASFNSTQRATVTNHLKEKHPTEWLILNEADNASSLPAGRQTNDISRGDLEEMVEKELTDGNQRRSDRNKAAVISNPGPTITSLPSRGKNAARVIAPRPAGNTAVITPGFIVRLPGGQHPVETIVALQTAVRSAVPAANIVNLQQQGMQSPAGAKTATPASAENEKRGRGRPKSIHSTVTGRLSKQSAKDTAGDSGAPNQSMSLRKSDPVRLSPLRPVLRRVAKCKPREFKDFVVSVPGRRLSPSTDSSDEDAEEDDSDGKNDKDDVPKEAANANKHRDKDATEPEKMPNQSVNSQPRQNQKVVRWTRRAAIKRKFQCLKCLTQFGTADALSRHGKLNRCIGIPITSEEFPCDQCIYKGTSVASLKIHRHIHMQRKEKKYGCTSCKKGFTTLKSVRRHRKSRCPVLKIKKPKVPKAYTCEQCDKVFKAKKALKEHMATHSELRHHKCDGCSKAFKTYGALRRHRKKHRDTFVYCDQCSFKTRWPSSLKTHFQAHHLEDNREYLQCPKCPYQTQNKYYLRRHIESHLDVRSFICEICGKDFKTQVILNTHLETHRNGEYKCAKCSYVGKTKMAIYSHQLVHMPRELMSYKCEQCDWVGKRKSELQIHYRKHSSLKLYHCSGCGKSYKHRHALSRHLSEKHLKKTVELSPLEADEMPSEQTAVLETVQDMLDSAQIGLQVQHQEEVHNGIPAILQGTQLKGGLNVQQYQVIQVPQVVEEVQGDQVDTLVTQQPHKVLQNPHVVMTAAPVPVAQFFEITTTDGIDDGHIPVHTAQ